METDSPKLSDKIEIEDKFNGSVVNPMPECYQMKIKALKEKLKSEYEIHLKWERKNLLFIFDGKMEEKEEQISELIATKNSNFEHLKQTQKLNDSLNIKIKQLENLLKKNNTQVFNLTQNIENQKKNEENNLTKREGSHDAEILKLKNNNTSALENEKYKFCQDIEELKLNQKNEMQDVEEKYKKMISNFEIDLENQLKKREQMKCKYEKIKTRAKLDYENFQQRESELIHEITNLVEQLEIKDRELNVEGEMGARVAKCLWEAAREQISTATEMIDEIQSDIVPKNEMEENAEQEEIMYEMEENEEEKWLGKSEELVAKIKEYEILKNENKMLHMKIGGYDELKQINLDLAQEIGQHREHMRQYETEIGELEKEIENLKQNNIKDEEKQFQQIEHVLTSVRKEAEVFRNECMNLEKHVYELELENT